MGWVLIVFVVALCVAGGWMQWRIVRLVLPMVENSPPFSVEQLPPHPDAEQVTFRTRDGLTLRGSLYIHTDRPARGLILFCHEFGGMHWSAQWYCAGLWEAGFNILAFDFRNQGSSDFLPGYEPLHWLTEHEIVDAQAALQFARSREELRGLPIGVFGISRGANAALAIAALNPEVCAVASDGAFSTSSMMLLYSRRWITLCIPQWTCRLVPEWHIRMTLNLVRIASQWRKRCRYVNLERWLPQLRHKPVLLISGGRDNYVLPEITRELCHKMAHSLDDIWTVPGAKHNMARQMAPQSYDQRLVEFFSEMGGEIETLSGACTSAARRSSV